MWVVCGEALMDVFATGSTAAGLALDARVGGSPFNVATGLARLAQPVSYFGGLSSDFVGERLLQALRDEGVDTRAVVRQAARSTLSLVGLDAQGVPSYSFYGEGGADRRLEPSALAQAPRAAGYHFGSFAMVVEPVASTLRALVERERSRSLIAYDPNLRLNVEPALDRWREVVAWMAARAHLVKISEEDLSLLRPGASAESVAAQWLADGVALVVVTRGGEGASAWTSRQHVAVPAVDTDLVDTVGAGDSFQAALLTWLAEHDRATPAALRALDATQIEAALRFATQAAAITCSRRGADLPRRAELD
ncbi:MAG TPA: carbohydrate kinase [Albitalea sp.]|uniref:carbohydrate kinase family protein n=1 Tax=Piscinibacter sp. TaxID=1903157 RepID=UPI002ED54516